MDELYMQRCLQLAALGSGHTAPNPMVGAVLVYNDHIIGEGYHQKYGEAHAEVNCINSVKEEDRQFVSQSKMYVSLEPCTHFGKTPPCSDLIITNKIQEVVIGCRDSFNEVNGKGIEKLQTAGVKTKVGILEKECRDINKRFFTFHEQQRPYIILKWAQTANGKIAASSGERLFISNEFTNRLVHKWRSEEASILVGTNTALHDDPALTTRLWKGNSPIRLVVDMNLRLPSFLKLFDQKQKTIVFNLIKQEEDKNLLYYQVTEDVNIVHQIVNALYSLKIQSVIVEGGAKLLQSFIDEGMWDETRIIENTEMTIENGLPAPLSFKNKKIEEYKLLSDTITIYRRN